MCLDCIQKFSEEECYNKLCNIKPETYKNITDISLVNNMIILGSGFKGERNRLKVLEIAEEFIIWNTTNSLNVPISKDDFHRMIKYIKNNKINSSDMDLLTNYLINVYK